MWKVCIMQPRYRTHNFDTFHIFTIKFSKSQPRNFQTKPIMTSQYIVVLSSLFKYAKKEELLQHILQSDIIIYDIISQPEQVDEATWAVSGV